MIPYGRFKRSLILWFRKNKRDLPWRRTTDPYKILCSEIMLQQTVITTVIPFYERWITRFPDSRTLARASETTVLRMWEGLGYYRRARNLRLAAKQIQSVHGGKVPKTYSELIQLPGVGDYTARAVLGIAFNEPLVPIDANVTRVMSRVLMTEEWSKDDLRNLQESFEATLNEGEVADFVEGLMEFGEVICRPREPDCAFCPVKRFCNAYRLGVQNEIPRKKTRTVVEKHTGLGLFVYESQMLVTIPDNKDFLGGLYSLPKLATNKTTFITMEKRARKMAGQQAIVCRELKTRTHNYTKYRDHLRPLLYKVSRRFDPKKMEKWIPLAHLNNKPFPSVYRKIVEEVQQTQFEE